MSDAGACGGMYTANTNVKSAIENLGMSLLTVYLSGLSQEKTRMH
jgi:dihydroxyacid dehydratase/phosphogluconate dehydratase